MIRLTEEQEIILGLLNTFWKSNEWIFQLDAPAGTGKTTLIGYFIRELMLRYDMSLRIVLCAFTNKAKKVLQKSPILQQLENLITICTIHQYMGARLDYDDEGNEFFINSNQYWSERDKKHIPSQTVDLLIIDEVSMVNDEQYKIIMEYVEQSMNMKIITLGDRCQLQPVQKREGVSLFYQHGISAQLTKNMRNQCPQMNEVLNEIREYILNEKIYNFPELRPKLSQVGESIKLINSENFSTIFKTEFHEAKDDEVIQFLSHKTGNKKNHLLSVSEYNDIIREKLFNLPKGTCPIQPSEQLQVMKTFGEGGMQYDVCDILKVVSTELSTKILDCGQDIWGQHEIFLLGLKEIRHTGETIETQELKLSDGNRISVVIGKESIDKFKTYQKTLREYIISHLTDKNIKKLKKFKSYRHMLWSAYYGFIYKINSPVEPYYANSIHKSQGSTFDKTFLNLGNFKWKINCKHQDFMNLLYVGLSRSKGKTYVLL